MTTLMLKELLQARDAMHVLLFHDTRATQTDIALAFIRLNNAIHGIAQQTTRTKEAA